jgi:hypothetical protein
MKCALQSRERKIDVINSLGGGIWTQNVNSCTSQLHTHETAIMRTPFSQNGSWNNTLHLQLPISLAGIITFCRWMNSLKIIPVSLFICSLHEIRKYLSVCRFLLQVYQTYSWWTSRVFGLMLFWFLSVSYFVPYSIWSGARGSVVSLSHYASSRKVAAPTPDALDVFNLLSPFSRTVTLRSTQPLTEMSTRDLPEGKRRPARKAENFTANCEPTV